MMKAKSQRHLRTNQRRFRKLLREQDLADLLEFPLYKLRLMATQPQYHLFGIPKKDGSQRWIENPGHDLKTVQRRLNFFLQCCYYFMRTPAAYGFLINAKRDDDPRHILSNAQRHLGASWLFNADVEDFFHRVSIDAVFRLFSERPFSFESELALLLAKLTTHQGRLPMGAPSSPVLSNFACIDLDHELQHLASETDLTYTRFADDMSFSAQREISIPLQNQIAAQVEKHGFVFNPAKIKLMGPDDPKVVTGLHLIGDEVELPKEIVKEMHTAIQKLGHAVDVQLHTGASPEWLENFQDQIEGMIEFAAFVLGDKDPVVLDAENRLARALDPQDEYSPVSWRNFAYFKQ